MWSSLCYQCQLEFSPNSAELASVSGVLLTASVKSSVQVLHNSDVCLLAYEKYGTLETHRDKSLLYGLWHFYIPVWNAALPR